MALSTSRTVLTQTGINTFLNYDIGGLNSAGIATFSNFKTGTTDVHSVGVNAATIVVGSAVTSNSDGIEVTGIVTATSFVGSGSGLTGVASTDHIKTSTVANFSGGIQVGSATTLTGNLVANTATANSIVVGSAVTVNSQGLDVTGVVTATNGVFSGSAKVGGGVDITAAGSGVFYTPGQSTAAGINFHDSDLRFFTSNTERFRITSGGNLDTINGTTSVNKHSVGVGTTTTAGRNAGVGTDAGTLIYNADNTKLQVYSGTAWVDVYEPPFESSGGTKDTSSRSGYAVHTFTSPGTFTLNQEKSCEVLIIGGGGGGGNGGGGAGALYYHASTTFSETPGSFTVTIGGGGSGNTGQGSPGSDSSIGSYTAAGGGGGGGPSNAGGKPGGSGGGGKRDGNNSSYAGPASGASGGSNNQASPGNGWGNIGGYGAHPTWCGAGGGGGAGSAGTNGSGGSGASETGGNGGNGLSYSITGSSVTRAGGGGGCTEGQGGPTSRGGNPGPGGGGIGAYSTQMPNPRPNTAGGTNTGSGGGGKTSTANPGSGSFTGGPGVVIVAVPTS